MKIIPHAKLWASLALTALLTSQFASQAAPQPASAKFEARLLWGTNDEKSPNPEHKKVDAELAKKLKTIPFKWKNFFEVSRQVFAVTTNYTRVVMSKQCSIDVKDTGETRIKVKMLGEGKEVSRIEKSMPKGETLIISGDNKNESAWLIVIKRVE